MKHSDYWRARFEQLEEAQLKKGLVYYDDLDREYSKAFEAIEEKIDKWYRRFAKNNEISLAEAKHLLNTDELKEFKWDVHEYIKYGQENAINGVWMKQLENASARVHISRLESLKLQMQQQVEALYGKQADGVDKTMRDIYSDSYYHTAYEIQRGFNVGYDLQKLDNRQISSVMSKPWTPDGKNFSDRIWTAKDQLVNTLHTELTQAIIRGDGPDKAIKTIKKKFNTSKYNAGRLVTTESAFFASAAQRDCFNKLSVDRYEIVATLDGKTSEICQELDGKVFSMKDYEPGVTAPPFHCWCRTVTAPYFDDNFGERAARDVKGKTYYVPDSIKYSEWKAKFVDKTVELPDLNKELKPILKKQEISPKMQNLFNKYLTDDYVSIDSTNSKIMYYNMNVGKIIVNPAHENIKYYNAPKALTHEIIHLIDDYEGIVIKNAAFLDENMDAAWNYIADRLDYYKELLDGSYADNMSISDLFSNLSLNKACGNFMHTNGYWGRVGIREKELIAALLTEYLADDVESLELINGIPALKSILERLVEVYGKITG
jgi:SPP1 gp7 family putative phage head morphogenesis protein